MTTTIARAEFPIGKFSVGAVAGLEFRYQESPIVDDVGNITGSRSQFKNLGLISVGVLKYYVTDYFNVFAGYGLAQRKFLEGSQVAVLGFQFDDMVGVTIFGGFDLGACAPSGCGSDLTMNGVVFDNRDVFGSIGDKSRWFIAIGWTFNAFSFELGNILEGETSNTLLPNS